MTLRLISVALVALSALPALAWNALGHKVVAEIAWRELTAEQREPIVEVLRRHPRFDTDFAKQMPADVAGDRATEDQWIFQHAATWPDIARGSSQDRPTWHYINRPVFVDAKRPVSANLSTKYPAREPLNCIQAVKTSLAALKSRASADMKALAYCWLFHLAGDMHQPMHAVALYGDYFPNGDRGGNSIPLQRGDNLHSLWDNLLGRQHYMRRAADDR